jgi:hypothetical protein
MTIICISAKYYALGTYLIFFREDHPTYSLETEDAQLSEVKL